MDQHYYLSTSDSAIQQPTAGFDTGTEFNAQIKFDEMSKSIDELQTRTAVKTFYHALHSGCPQSFV